MHCRVGLAILVKVAEIWPCLDGGTQCVSIMPAAMKDNFTVGSDRWREEQGFPGVPVSRTAFSGGKTEHRTTVKSVTRAEFEDALFAAPAGYKKEAMPKIGGR